MNIMNENENKLQVQLKNADKKISQLLTKIMNLYKDNLRLKKEIKDLKYDLSFKNKGDEIFGG